MEFLRVFETESEYNSFKNGENVIYPHVCYTEDDDKLHVLKEEPSNEITFYIYGNEHKAIKGMTWGEWCTYGIRVDIDGKYDANYSVFPGYNDGSDDIDGFQLGCETSWRCGSNGQISSSVVNPNDHWMCIGRGTAYIKDVTCEDIIENKRNYDIDKSNIVFDAFD